MAEFSKLVITKAGQALIAKIMAGEASDVDFIRVAASKATFTVDELEMLSTLPDIMQEVEISYKARTNDVAVTIETAFSNHELTVGYSMNTLGLFAADPDEGEILYAVCVETSGNCYMPPYNGITVSGAYIQLITTVGNADKISLEVNPAASATFADIKRLQEQIDDIKTTIDLNNMDALISIHNLDPKAHPTLRVDFNDVDARLALLELMYRTQVNGNPFTVSFGDLNDLLVTGVWNAVQKRIEF